MTDTTPDDALKDTQREMDECCPLADIHVIEDGKKVPCTWPGHTALKRRDAAVRLDVMDSFKRDPSEDFVQYSRRLQKAHDAARRAYQEASNGK